MRIALSYFLSFVLLLVSLSQTSLLTGYYINQSGIIESFCVNTDRPEMNCEGMCYLESKLGELNDGNEDESMLPVSERFEVNVFQHGIVSLTVVCNNELSNYYFFNDKIPADPFAGECFHPPKSAV